MAEAARPAPEVVAPVVVEPRRYLLREECEAREVPPQAVGPPAREAEEGAGADRPTIWANGTAVRPCGKAQL